MARRQLPLSVTAAIMTRHIAGLGADRPEALSASRSSTTASTAAGADTEASSRSKERTAFASTSCCS